MRTAAAAFALLLVVPVAAADHADLAELYEIAPWGALDSIREPRFDDELYVYAWDEVVGIAINGEARTYPLKLMHWHEVVNDVVGGVPIVVSLCPLCGTALVFERTYGGRVLTFGSSGFLYRNNKVMFDEETGSLWPQILGVAINGTYHGTRLVGVPFVRMSFEAWVALHPEAMIVARPWGPVLCPDPCPIPLGFVDYDHSPYDNATSSYEETNDTYAPIRSPDPRMHPKTYVVGLARGGDALAIPHPILARERVVHASVGGEEFVVALWRPPQGGRMPDSAHAYLRGGHTFRGNATTNELIDEAGNRYAIQTGEGVAASLTRAEFIYGYWFAWHDLYPATRVCGIATPDDSLPWYLTLLAVPIGAAAVVVLRRRARGDDPS